MVKTDSQYTLFTQKQFVKIADLNSIKWGNTKMSEAQEKIGLYNELYF